MGPPAIWGPPYPHITSDMRPGEAHTSSVMDLPSDIGPPLQTLKNTLYYFKLMITAFYLG